MSAARRELRAPLADDGECCRSALAAVSGAVGTQQKLVVAMIDGIVDDQALPDDLQAWLGFGGLAQRPRSRPATFLTQTTVR